MILLPLLPLLVGALLSWLARRRHERVSWALALASATLAWAASWGLRGQIGDQLSVTYWGRGDGPLALEFDLDRIGWQALVLTATGLLAIVLTGVTRWAAGSAAPRAGMLAYGGLASVAMLSGSMLSAVVSWSALDLVFILVLRPVDRDEPSRRDFGDRVALNLASVGMMTLAAAMELGAGGSTSFSVAPVSPGSAVLLAVAGLLRLGLLPPHFNLPDVHGARRGLGTALRLLPPVVALATVGRALQGGAPGEISWLLWVVGAGGAGVGALRWLLAEDALEGRRFYVVGVCGLGVLALANPSLDASVPLSAAIALLMLPGSMLSLVELRDPVDKVWPVLAAALILGVPGTPGAFLLEHVGEPGGPEVRLGLAATIVGLSMLALGSWRAVRGTPATWPGAEPMYRIVYRAGMIVCLVVALAMGLEGGAGPSADGWIGFGVGVALVGLGIYAHQRLDPRRRRRLARLALLLDPSPVYRAGGAAFAGVGGALRALMSTLEGAGALVWTYVVILLVWLAAQ